MKMIVSVRDASRSMIVPYLKKLKILYRECRIAKEVVLSRKAQNILSGEQNCKTKFRNRFAIPAETQSISSGVENRKEICSTAATGIGRPALLGERRE